MDTARLLILAEKLVADTQGGWWTRKDIVAAFEEVIAESTAELRLTLLNERGEGDPPSPKWSWGREEHAIITNPYEWLRSDTRIPTTVWRGEPGFWHWQAHRGGSKHGSASTAREAMRLADAALEANE